MGEVNVNTASEPFFSSMVTELNIGPDRYKQATQYSQNSHTKMAFFRDTNKEKINFIIELSQAQQHSREIWEYI